VPDGVELHGEEAGAAQPLQLRPLDPLVAAEAMEGEDGAAQYVVFPRWQRASGPAA
jgi:hypothetical protein